MSRAPESVYLKLAQAKKHLEALETEIAAFRDTNPYAVTHEISRDRRQMTLKFVVLRIPPTKLAIILGDCVHNLRSALDHLVFALPRAVGTDPRWEDWSQFPICDNAGGFQSVRGRYLCGVSSQAGAAVEGLQPYVRVNRPEGHGLWYLRELSNLDKHRLSPFVYHVASHGSIQMPQPPTGSAHAVFNSGDIDHGATVAKVYLSDPAPPEVEVTVDLTLGITIRELGPPDMPKLGVNAALERIYSRAINAVIVLEPFLA